MPPERAGLKPILEQAAQEQGLPPDLVLAQAWVESSWREKAVSSQQAVGVLQLTPATVDFVSRRLLRLDHTLDPFDPVANARMGTRYLRHLLEHTGHDLRQALIAYNQGLAALRSHGPYSEAVSYAERVLTLRSSFADQPPAAPPAASPPAHQPDPPVATSAPPPGTPGSSVDARLWHPAAL